MKLNAHSANPVLDVLKRIDYHKAVLQYLDRTIQEKHQFVLLHATSTYQSPEDVLADRATTAGQLKRRVEDCLRLVKLRNVSLVVASSPCLLFICLRLITDLYMSHVQKYMAEIPSLKKQLVRAVAKMKQDEVRSLDGFGGCCWFLILTSTYGRLFSTFRLTQEAKSSRSWR